MVFMETFYMQKYYCEVDWRWFQPGLISPVTWVRIPPPLLIGMSRKW